MFFFNFLKSIHVALLNLYSIFYEIRWCDCDKKTNSPFSQEILTLISYFVSRKSKEKKNRALYLLPMCTKKHDSEWDGVNNHGA